MQRQKHLIEGLTSLVGLISNSEFMARLSDWMGAMAGLLPLDPPLCQREYGDLRSVPLGRSVSGSVETENQDGNWLTRVYPRKMAVKAVCMFCKKSY